MRVALVTADYGNYATPPPNETGYDGFLFSNYGAESPNWITIEDNEWPAAHHRKASRMPKVDPFSYNAIQHYDSVLWLDASITLTDPGTFVETMLEYLGDAEIALIPHPHRQDIFKEAQAAYSLPKLAYDADKMLAQVNEYSAQGFPIDTGGLYAMTTFIIRNTPTMRGLGKRMRQHLIAHSDMDQLALPVVLWEFAKFRPRVATIPIDLENNDLFQWKNRVDA